MKVICDKTILSAAVSGVARAVSARSSISVLEGILIKADGFQITLTGYDLELSITTSIEANVLEPGDVVLPAKLLSDVVHRMPLDEIEIFVAENNETTIKSGITEYNVMGMNPADFPDMPAPGADHTLDIEAGLLREMIESTLFAVSTDEKKPEHTGALFAIEPQKLTVVALDGFRLAIVEREISATKDINIIIPAKTLSEVNKLLGDDNGLVHISANRRFVIFSTRKYMIMSRLIEGSFLDYRRVIPEGYKTKAIVETSKFAGVIERASLIITERLKDPLHVLFTDKVTVRCQTTLGKVVDEIEAHIEGESIEIGFNNRYLLDALRNSGCNKVIFEMNGPLSPVKVLPEEGNAFLYLVLPVRFKND